MYKRDLYSNSKSYLGYCYLGGWQQRSAGYWQHFGGYKQTWLVVAGSYVVPGTQQQHLLADHNSRPELGSL